jgi:hypothetical protein
MTSVGSGRWISLAMAKQRPKRRLLQPWVYICAFLSPVASPLLISFSVVLFHTFSFSPHGKIHLDPPCLRPTLCSQPPRMHERDRPTVPSRVGKTDQWRPRSTLFFFLQFFFLDWFQLGLSSLLFWTVTRIWTKGIKLKSSLVKQGDRLLDVVDH